MPEGDYLVNYKHFHYVTSTKIR